MTATKKIYIQPSVKQLGSIAEKTQSGAEPNSDNGLAPNNANLYIPPGS